MDQFDLSGKVAIVTGGNGGIGRGIAVALARAGADTVIAARNPEKNASTAAAIEDLGARCLSLECNVDDAAHVASVIEQSKRDFGGIDILVNNAGIARGAPPEALDDETWGEVLQTNLTSVFRFSRAVHPELKARGGGKIINIGSEYAIFGSPLVVPYSASKGGVVQLTKSLAVAWARDNIQVNCIIPGWINTDMTAGIQDVPAFHQQIIARTPAARFGEPEECGGAAVFLASQAANFVTGISLPVDGGYAIA
jgi:2-deoxy-D-gluconate 3-dehydrogenase